MVEAKTRRFATALALMAGVALSGCEVSQDGPEFPPPPSETFTAQFSLQTGAVPWPWDLYFFGGTTPFDGTLDIPPPLNAAPFVATPAMAAALNSLDGFSTSAPANTSFNHAIDPASLSGSSVVMVEMYLSNGTKLPAGASELPPGVTSAVVRKLAYGVDFTAEVSSDIDSYGRILRITPLKPLKPSTGAFNTGYYVYLTNGIKDTEGRSVEPDSFYSTLTAAPADCSSFTAQRDRLLCGWTKAHQFVAQGVGVDPSTVVLSWNFTTQSVEDTFDVLAALVPGQPIGVVPTGLSTAAIGGQGKANIYVGTTQVPYYLRAPTGPADAADAVLKSFWQAAGPSPSPAIDPNSRNVTRFNPVPGATGIETIPLLVTIPNATGGGGLGCTKPEAGWPVAIFQHGIGRNRTDALAMADSFAEVCFIVASIDLPLHGVTSTNPATDPIAAFYQAGNERTFDVDLVNNTPGATGPDGVIDDSGTHWINLASPLTSRDNTRQAEADLIVFTKSLANLDVTGDGQPDVDPTRIHLVAYSLGGIVGGAHAHHTNARTVSLVNSGGVLSKLVLDSAYLGPRIRAGLNAFGLVDNSTLFNNYVLRDFQTVVDSADPINHICDCSMQQPVHLIQVKDDGLVPNNSTQRLVTAGNLRQVSAEGPNPVGPAEGVWVSFIEGDHGSLISQAASAAATAEMQGQTVGFAASAVQPGGPFVVITDTSVIGD